MSKQARMAAKINDIQAGEEDQDEEDNEFVQGQIKDKIHWNLQRKIGLRMYAAEGRAEVKRELEEIKEARRKKSRAIKRKNLSRQNVVASFLARNNSSRLTADELSKIAEKILTEDK